MGWSWIGKPGQGDVLQGAVSVRDDETMVVRTAEQDYDDPTPWVNWNWLYWDSVADTTKIMIFAGGDDNLMREWYGYRVWTNRDKLSLIIP